jgi:toxin YhaV
LSWNKLWLPIFEVRYLDILSLVKKSIKEDPDNFYNKKIYKFWECVTNTLENHIFISPSSEEFLLGNTLGKDNRSWKRAKKGLPSRYRLFFKYSSTENTIVIAWLNDDKTLRKDGSKSDVYAIFKKKLDSGKVPSNLAELIDQSSKVILQ